MITVSLNKKSFPLIKTLGLVLALLSSVLTSSLSYAVTAECGEAFGSSASNLRGAPVSNVGLTFKPKLIIFSAPSGGGKTTLAQMLVKEFPNSLQISVSSTTRAPRGQEKDGVDYHFLSVEEFKQKIKAGDFAEHAEVHGNFYGTDVSTIKNSFSQGKSVLALVDIAGAAKLKEAFPGEVVTIFISPPDLKILEQRLRARGTETEAAIQLRLANAKKEMEAAKDFDQVVVNDDLQTAFNDLKKLLAPFVGK